MRHVALLIETSREFGRGLLGGIARYNQEHRQWLTYCRPQGMGDLSHAWLQRWPGDGILARIRDRRMAAAIAKLNVPVVNLRGWLADCPFPYVGVDDRAIAHMAAEHLLSRGFRHFGFCGYRRGYIAHLDQRCDAFCEFVRSAGKTCEVCGLSEPAYDRQDRGFWEREQAHIARWIRSLPKPAAIMACHDDRGLQVLEACRQIGAAVPDEVAVIGVANDACLCSLSIPPLTSVDVNAEQIGYRAAALLDELMVGGNVPQRVVIAPRFVVARQSTDVTAVQDHQVVAAIRFIRDRAGEQIHIEDVVRQVGLSRSVIESRFKAAIGRTVHQEIRRVRIECVKQLLAATNLPIKQVASRAGFRSVQYLTRAFQAATRQTPAAFRRRMQP